MCYPRSMRRSTSPTGGYRLRMEPDIQFTSRPSHWKMYIDCTSREAPPPNPRCGPYCATLGSKIPFGLGRNSRGRTSETETLHHCLIKSGCHPYTGEAIPHESGGPMRNRATHTMAPGGGNSQKVSIPIEYPPTTCEKAWGNGFQASPGSSRSQQMGE